MTSAIVAPPDGAIPVLIVTYRNAVDVIRCLQALGRMQSDPAFSVFICENGGSAAFDTQIAALTAPDGVCDPDHELIDAPMLSVPRLSRIERLRLRVEAGGPAIYVQVGEAQENYGYAGGVNSFLGPLLESSGWPGAWVLNPDTEPAHDALFELQSYASRNDRCMVGSRLVSDFDQDFVQMRGLAWRKWRGATAAVDRLGPVVPTQPADMLAGKLDAPSGASTYITRNCILRIGLMDERYFLYFEDLEWGMRAKRRSPIGYAYHSIVIHEGGTTTGSPQSRRNQSALTTYLDCRNRLLFVRRHFGWWLAWMALIEVAEIGNHARRGEFASMRAAARGLIAGLLDHGGRPESMMRAHKPGSGGGPKPARRRATQPKDWIKIGASVCAWAMMAVGRTVTARSSPPPLVVLYYHGVSGEYAPDFARQMRQLERWARVVPADWSGDGTPDRRPPVAITFDDAFDSVLDHALPILAGHGFVCTIFVPTGYAGQVPSWVMDRAISIEDRVASADRLSRLDADLVTLGSHTATHPHLPALTPADMRRELMQSRQDLAAMTGREPRLFAFPYGAYDEAAIAACRECGYERVFTIEPTLVVPQRSAYERGRVAAEPSDGRLTFYLKATGCYRWMARVSAAKRGIRRLVAIATVDR